jgi:uroporphyrinogen-III synthase
MVETGSASTLAGWYVISLRPSGTHAPLRRAAAAHGARVLPLSTLRLRPLAAEAALAVALACPLVVFTSPAAVRFARTQAALRAQPAQQWFALGGGTAAALRRAGIADAQVPAGRPDSEGLLDLPALAAPTAAVGLVTAPGGRGVIAETLARRGARVHRAEVYRREPVAPRADRLRALATLPAHSALLVSSAEAFAPMWSALEPATRTLLRGRPVVAASPRLAAQLADDGFSAIVPADGARPAQLLEALVAAVAAGRFR